MAVRLCVWGEGLLCVCLGGCMSVCSLRVLVEDLFVVVYVILTMWICLVCHFSVVWSIPGNCYMIFMARLIQCTWLFCIISRIRALSRIHLSTVVIWYIVLWVAPVPCRWYCGRSAPPGVIGHTWHHESHRW